MVPADAEDAISSSPIVVAITNLNADIRNIFLTPLKQLRRRSVKVKSFFIRSRNWCEIQDKLSEAPQTLARSSTSNRRARLRAVRTTALLLEYKHCESETDDHVDAAVGVQPAKHGRNTPL